MKFNVSRTRENLLQSDKIVIYGAGNYLAEMLMVIPRNKLLAIVDGDENKVGKSVEKKWIIQPADYMENIEDDTAVVLGMVSHAYDVFILLTEKYGVNEKNIYTMQRPFLDEMFKYDILDKNLDKVKIAYDLLADKESKLFYNNYFEYVLSMSPKYLKGNKNIIGKYSYKITDDKQISPCNKMMIIDCGAYIGDTAELFIKQMKKGGKIVCIEGFKENCMQINEWIKNNNLEKKVSLIEGCIGDEEKTVEINVGGVLNDSATIFTSTNKKDINTAKMYTLDALFSDEKVDFIKFDIEGSEMNALRGANNVIRVNKPQMMVSAYHKLEHLWEIPIFLHDILPEYRFYFGHQPHAAMEPEFYVTI